MGFLIKNIRHIKAIRAAAKALPKDFQPSNEAWQKQFALVWPLLKPVFELVKSVAPERVDFAIDEIGVIADEIATNGASERESVFIQRFAEVWPFGKFALGMAMYFTGDKIDAILDRIIQWGDWLASQAPKK